MDREQPQHTIARFSAQRPHRKNLASGHLGQAVLVLRREARDEISSFRANRLLRLAEGIEDRLLPAVQRLEWSDDNWL